MLIQTNPTMKAQLLAWADKRKLWYDYKDPDLGFIWREAVIHYGLVGMHILSHPDLALLGDHAKDFLSAGEEKLEVEEHKLEPVKVEYKDIEIGKTPFEPSPKVEPIKEEHKEEEEEKKVEEHKEEPKEEHKD